MYTLYTDKNETFSADVSVKNANLKNSIARLVVETEDLNLIFKGKIQDGKCEVPIKKLKGLLDESCSGDIHLEIVVEDTFFKPWSDKFIVEEHTSVKVQVKEQVKPSNKPLLEVKVNNPTPKHSTAARELLSLCEKFDISSNNYKTKKRADFKQLVKEYFNYNTEFKNQIIPILNEVVTSLK